MKFKNDGKSLDSRVRGNDVMINLDSRIDPRYARVPRRNDLFLLPPRPVLGEGGRGVRVWHTEKYT